MLKESIGRAEHGRTGKTPQVGLIPGQDQPTTHLHRDGDHVGISKVI